MDPISTGLTLGTALVMPLAKQLLEKKINPETVAKSVNWVLSAADHFLKIRRGQTSPDEPAPPVPGATTEEEGVQILPPPHFKPDMDTFALDLLTGQVEGLMKQIEIYVGNLQHVLQQAAQYGGEEFAPIHVANQIKLQRQSIVERLDELTAIMNQVYGVQIEEVDGLAMVFKPS